MRKPQPSITRRLIQLFLLLLFPLMILGTIIFQHNVRQLEQNVAAVTQQSVLTLCSDLEQQVLEIGNDLYSLLKNPNQRDVRGFLAYQHSFSTADYYITIRSIRSMLQEIRMRHELIEDIEVFYPALRQSLSLRLGLQENQNRDAYLDAGAVQMNGIAEVDGRLCILHVTPQPSRRDGIQILVIAHLSAENLADALAVPPYPDQPTALLYGEAGIVIGNHAYQQLPAAPDSEYRLFTAKSSILNSRIEKRLRTANVFAVSRRLSQMLVVYLVVGFVLFVFYIFFIRRLVSAPVTHLIEGMNHIRQGELSFRLQHTRQAEEFARLTDGLNELVEQINELIETNYQQEIDNRTFELKHLQAQISPHFLYNSLYILRHMIDCEDNESAAIMVQHLGDYFHYTAATDNMEISFAQEYEHGKNYLSIQCIRFKGWLVAEYQEVPENWANLLVPKLIIQPLYENAVHYAIRKDGKELLIRTSFAERDGYGVICVEDSGMALSEEKLAEMQRHLYARTENDNVTALYNIHRRLQLRYGNHCSVNLSQSSLGGLRVELTFSLK